MMPRGQAVCLAIVFLTVTAVQAQAPPDAGLQWARIPAGTFQMGCISADARCDADEHPRHAVTISRAFDLMPTEVTVAMYRGAVKEVDEQPAWSKTPDQPVVIVTWEEELAFCQAIGGRLPTEAEWERGGREGAICPWGDQPPDDRDGAANGVAFESDSARAVKSFAPNACGLYAWRATSGNGSRMPMADIRPQPRPIPSGPSPRSSAWSGVARMETIPPICGCRTAIPTGRAT